MSQMIVFIGGNLPTVRLLTVPWGVTNLQRVQGVRLPDSPFELESVLIEHEAVAEAAVVPSPDPVRLAVPKAYVTLVAGADPSAETALAILAYARGRLAPYKRIRRLEFAELPKTISGKIRRVELRQQETVRLGPAAAGAPPGVRGVTEFWEEDFPALKS